MQAAGLTGREGAEAEREIGVESARIERSAWRRRAGKGASPELRRAARVAVEIGWRSMAGRCRSGLWGPSRFLILIPLPSTKVFGKIN